ncbi:ArnT family glycosyltransferase [Paenibacillus algicola]|uniref:ArnT family glycosyltransferase n=1 Tax=Paenibacillus algicola TaxID=2565926 RepID=UPI001585FA59|nr:glycosyltransferase family 39 protein [Paenibacillus algicola]
MKLLYSYLQEDRVKKQLYPVVLAVFLISVVVVLYHGNGLFLGDPEKLNNDDVKYIHTARVLLNEGTLVYNSGEAPSAFIMPGLPLLLSGFMAVFGQEQGGVTAFRVFQSVLQAASIVLIYLLSRYTFSHHKVAMLGVVIAALYIPDYFTSGSILTESSFRTLILMLLCAMITAVHTKKIRWYLAVGLLTAAAAYFKPQASLFPCMLLFIWLAHRYTLKEIVRFTLVVIGSYILLLIPWWIRNLVTFGEFILFTSSAGSPFLLGTMISYELPPAGFFTAYPQYDPKTVFEGSDAAAIQKGMDILKYGFTVQPLTYLYHYSIGRFEALYLVPFYLKDLFSIPKPFVQIMQQVIVYTGLVGIVWASVRKVGKSMLPLLLLLIYFTLIHLPFVAMSRYGYPTSIVFILFSGYAFMRLYGAITNKPGTNKEESAHAQGTRHHSGLQ